jgi:hypothetical protein
MALLGLAVAPAASAASTNISNQTINYHGYEFQVPASWPVYNLATDPTRCVLFNQHAVYLGTPGADQQCPPRAYGRTEALLVQPEQSTVPAGTVELGSSTASFSNALTANETVAHTVQFTAPGPGVQVTASYGSDEAQIRSILAGAQMTAKSSAEAPAVSAPAIASGKAPAVTTGHAKAGRNSAAVKPRAGDDSGLSEEQAQGLGVDTCTVPSAATMSDWLASPYRVISTYLGGANWACSYGDFTSSWVGQVASEGWQFIPIWVGPQASCTQATGTTEIDPTDAAAEGQAEAASAVAAAQEFGYGAGTPIYYDMESYDNSDTSCSQAVLTFLSAWTQALHSAGYLSGVYSSAATGISDLVSQYSGTTYQSPDDVWFADWNTDPVTTSPYIPAADWQGATMHQYYGSHNETWGGATLNVDSDVVDAAVAGDPGAATTGLPTVTDQPAAISVPPGGTGITQLQIQSGGAQTESVQWIAHPPAGITVAPSSGIAIVSGDGVVDANFRVLTDGSLAPGRYDVPITATAYGQPITETFVLVTTGASVASPVVLYAADSQSMSTAVTEAQQLGLPAANVTGDFDTAWSDLSGGDDLVITVGAAAGNALWHNGCAWTTPAGTSSTGTPFGFDDVPMAGGSSGAFEAALGTTTAALETEVAQYAQFQMAGTVPNDSAAQTLGSATPGDTCLGSSDVPVQ